MSHKAVFGKEDGTINWPEQHYRILSAKRPGFFMKSFCNILVWFTFVFCQLLSEDRCKRRLVITIRMKSPPFKWASHFIHITCKNVTISLEQASRLILRTVTYSPVGLYLARFTVIRSSNPFPKIKREYHKQEQQQQRLP